MPKFVHSGALGDIIYALPAIKYLGGGTLYLNKNFVQKMKTYWAMGYTPNRFSTGLAKPDGTPNDLTDNSINLLKPLLNKQDYLQVEVWDGEEVDYDLDLVRTCSAANQNLAEWYSTKFTLPLNISREKWLNVEPKSVSGVIISRSPRYHNEIFPWGEILETHKDNLAFIGFKQDYIDFTDKFGWVPYLETKNLLEAAEIIAGCWLFIGNQSPLYAIAEGLKKRSIQETWPVDANCMFARPNATYFIKHYKNLPYSKDVLI